LKIVLLFTFTKPGKNMTQRPAVIIGNWKMNKTLSDTKSFILGLVPSMQKCVNQVGLAVPFTMLAAAIEAAANTPIMIGAQNVSNYEHGAYTGETSCAMIKDAGASFVLIGHSERRRLFHESNKVVNEKICKSLEWCIKPVFCIGETLEEHQNGETHEVLNRQITQGLKGLSNDQIKSLIIAYEPVWAIGTNQAATPDVVQKTHAYCRSILAKEWGNNVANHTVIQYGGSVTADNASALLNESDIDGLLIGGASLSLETFSKIILTSV
jgi:triosephosphate isomerase